MSENGPPNQFLLGEWSNVILYSEGEQLDISANVIEICVEENIFSPYVRGYVHMRDAASYKIIRKLKLKGGPETTISFSFCGLDDKKNPQPKIEITKGDYLVYGFDPISPFNKTSEDSVLYFIHKCFYLDQEKRISRCFSKQKISDIVQELGNEIEITWKEVEKTKGDITTALTYGNTIEHISTMLKYSVREENIDDVNYVFWQNLKKEHNYISLAKLYSKESTFGNQPEPSGNDFSSVGFIYGEFLTDKDYSITRRMVSTHEAINKGLLEESLAGTFASAVFTVDPHYENGFDYSTYDLKKEWNKQTHITENKFIDDDSQFWEYIKGPMCYRSYNVKQHSYCCKEKPGGQRNEPYCVSKRLSQLGQLFQLGVEFVASGNSDSNEIAVGNIIYFSRPLFYDPEKDQKQEDIFYRGKFLVTTVKHVIQIKDMTSPKYFCRIRAYKDSVDK